MYIETKFCKIYSMLQRAVRGLVDLLMPSLKESIIKVENDFHKDSLEKFFIPLNMKF